MTLFIEIGQIAQVVVINELDCDSGAAVIIL